MNVPRTTELAYTPDSGLLLERLLDSDWCVFLDSGHPRAAQGRYDIIAADPIVTLTTRGAVTEVRSVDKVVHSERDPLALLKEQLGERLESPPGIPFPGGAIGYLSYDLGRRFERLPVLARRDLDLPELAVGIYDWAVVIDHKAKRSWLVGAGRHDRTFEMWQGLLARLEPTAAQAAREPFQVLTPIACNFDIDAYSRAFRKVKRYIRDGDCYQVNLTQRFSVQASGHPWEAYRRLRPVNPAPFSAYVATPYGAILSSSPERFLCVRDGEVETKPIKGTRPRSSERRRDLALAEELRRSTKDQAENVMIVDLLRNDLGKSCVPGSITVPSLFAVESFVGVHHLVSTVTGRLAADKHPLDLLRGCFPGGSITGAPKVRAMEIIEELEPHRRTVYCGAIGYVGYDGSMDTNIAIRTLLCQDGQLHAWAGGGIVADSELEAEYQESLDKAAALLKVMTIEKRSQVGS